MKKRFLFLILISILFIIPNALKAHADSSFYRTLNIGSTGSDVLALQQFLNKDPRTQLAFNGPGSPGQETTYYGNLTFGAVTKFQSLYGIITTVPGSIDLTTLNFLNSLTSTSAILAATSTGALSQDQLNATFQIGVNPNVPFISSITPKAIVSGDTVVITGKNFSTGSPNTIRLSYNSVYATSTDGVTLSVKVDSQLSAILNEEIKDLDSDDKDKVKNQIPPIPLFIMVQNELGLSNPYEIFVAFSNTSLQSHPAVGVPVNSSNITNKLN